MFLFFFNDTATTEIYTLSLHDALPISRRFALVRLFFARIAACFVVLPHRFARFYIDRNDEAAFPRPEIENARSEEHTSELQSPCNLVCRLLLEKKNNAR